MPTYRQLFAEDREFAELVVSETAATAFLAEFLPTSENRVCLFCQAKRPYALKSGRYRCRQCRRDFGAWTGRWLGALKITAKDWVYLLKCFANEVLPHQIRRRSDLSYPTLLRSYRIMRSSLFQEHVPKANLAWLWYRRLAFPFQLDESQIEIVNRSAGKPREINGCAHNSANRISLALSPEAQQPNLQKRFADFGDYVQGKLKQHRGINPKYFLLYLNEWAFRFNHRNQDIFEALARGVCQHRQDQWILKNKKLVVPGK